MADQEWLQMELLVDATQAESLGGLLFDLGALGVEEHPVDASAATGPDWAFSTPAETDETDAPPHTRLVVYLPLDLPPEQQREITDLAMRFGVRREDIVWSRLRDDGWSTKWQAFFRPLPIGERLLICPTWEELPAENERHVIWLDPGMAFGTGHHATTRSCLQLLETLLQGLDPTPPVLDVGCGSGILSMAAVHLGAPEAHGIDIDADAIAIAIENAEHNKLQERCHFATTPITEIKGQHPLIVANIQAHILKPMAHTLRALMTEDGALLLSGIWHEFADDLIATFQQLDLEIAHQIADEDWITVCFRPHKTRDEI